MKTTQKAYAAGFLDADGSIHIVKGRPRVSISQVNKDPLILFAKWFGGGINWSTNRTGRGRWTWTITGEGAFEFLRAIQPYVVAKKGDVKGVLDPSD